MEVTLIAHTMMTGPAYDIMDSWNTADDPSSDPEDNDRVVEFGGRACYQSWNHPNPKTAANRDYIGHILDVEHASVLEHSVVTLYITGVSRSLTHELIRHRHLSPSQQSQRYVDESKSTFIEPPLFNQLRVMADTGADDDPRYHPIMDAIDRINRVAYECRAAYQEFVDAVAASGLRISRKESREAARSILPNGTETRIVLTGNLRAWRHFLHMRYSVHADAEIMELARQVLGVLRDIAPNCVQDISDELRK